MKNSSINIIEIARLANVHPSTVSRALNGSTLVKEETRLKIQKIAQQYDYIPDAVAQSLNQGKTSVIGIVVPDISSSFYSRITDSIEQIMVHHGYNFIMGASRFDAETELRTIRTMISRRVDALIVCAPTSSETICYLENIVKRIPIIICDTIRSSPLLDCVYVDNHQGIQSAVQYLKDKGIHEIGCIADNTSMRRMEVFTDVLRECGLPVIEEYLYSGEYSGEDTGVPCGYNGLYALSQRGSLPPALFVSRDYIAVGVMRAAIELGLEIPSQLSLSGYDDLTISRYMYKKLTTIHQPVESIGKHVAEILLGRLNGSAKNQAIANIRLDSKLIVRETT